MTKDSTTPYRISKTKAAHFHMLITIVYVLVWLIQPTIDQAWFAGIMWLLASYVLWSDYIHVLDLVGALVWLGFFATIAGVFYGWLVPILLPIEWLFKPELTAASDSIENLVDTIVKEP